MCERCGLDCEGPVEYPPCLICGEPTREGEPCTCLWPTRIITLTFEIRCPNSDMPAPDELRQAVEEGLHEDWFTPEVGDPWYVHHIGFPGDLGRSSSTTCPGRCELTAEVFLCELGFGIRLTENGQRTGRVLMPQRNVPGYCHAGLFQHRGDAEKHARLWNEDRILLPGMEVM